MGGAVVAVDAVHYAAFALGLGFCIGGRKGDDGAVGVVLFDPRNDGAGGVGGDIFHVAQVDAVDAGEVGEGVAAAEMEDEDGLGLGVLSSSAKFDLTKSFSPMKRAGVWHPSQM